LREFSQNGEEGSFRIGKGGVGNHKVPSAGRQFGHCVCRAGDNTDSPIFDVQNVFEGVLAGNVVIEDQDAYVRQSFFS
jgi:hypothetical protein